MPPSWDSTGWTLLGSQWVDGKRDRDVIRYDRKDRFDRITLVVSESDLELIDFVVVFGDGERWEPKLKHHFREGQRTHALDLPGENRMIKEIDLVYANTPGGGRARVEVYAKDVKGVRKPTAVEPMPPPPPPPAEPAFDPAGWTLLGSQWVDGKKDRDFYPVGKAKGRFDRIVIVVKESDLEMDDFVITFENKEKFEPKLKHVFKEGTRSRSIDLPGSDRYIKDIMVKYANLKGGGRARVEIYGKDTNEGKDPKKPRKK